MVKIKVIYLQNYEKNIIFINAIYSKFRIYKEFNSRYSVILLIVDNTNRGGGIICLIIKGGVIILGCFSKQTIPS